MRKYTIIVTAFQIIQERQPIKLSEVCRIIPDRTGYEVSYSRLGQYLRPFVREGQLNKILKRDGSYYETGTQAIKLADGLI